MSEAPARVDVVVVGSGGAGLATAVVAHDIGASVLVAERSVTVGGTYARGTGLAWVPGNHYAPYDSRADAAEYARGASGGRHDEAHLAAFLEHARVAFAYLEDAAEVPFEIVPDYPDVASCRAGGVVRGHYLSSPVFPARELLPDEWRARLATSAQYRGLPLAWREIQDHGGYGALARWDENLLAARVQDDRRGFGGATAGALLAAVLRRGIPILLETSAIGLVRTGAAVTGIRLRGIGGESQVAVRGGVILAAGGYDANADLKRRLGMEPETVPLGAKTIDGSGIRLAGDLGAAFAVLTGQMLSPVYHVADERDDDGDAVWRPFVREGALPGGIIVNRAGRRFADEAAGAAVSQAMAWYDQTTQQHPNHPAYALLDSQWVSTYALGPARPDERPEWLCRGDDVSQLAERLGIDSGGLRTTINEFNRDAVAAEDRRFGRGSTAYDRNLGDPSVRPNPCLRPLEPPLYGIELRLGSAGTNAGLVTTAAAEVVSVRGERINGLYAVGNTAANLVGGFFYNSGLANAKGITFGYLAARHAAARVHTE